MTDGTYTVTATSGTSPYNMLMPSLMAAAAGVYSVVVTDAAGCIFTLDVTVNEFCPDNFCLVCGGGSFTSEVGWSIVDAGTVMHQAVLQLLEISVYLMDVI